MVAEKVCEEPPQKWRKMSVEPDVWAENWTFNVVSAEISYCLE